MSGRPTSRWHVRRRRTAGWPTGREPYGHGVPVVVAGVTTCQGGRESRLQGEAAQVLTIERNGEVREMRDAATVSEIIRERGSRGLPLERVYRCLFHPGLYLLAYGKLYRNAGAMTPGATGETVDGMHLGKIKDIIGALRSER